MSALPQPGPGTSLPAGLEDLVDIVALSAPAAPEISVLALLRTLGVGPGSRVALPVWGCAGVAETLQLCDYEVLPLDVDPGTGRLDVSAVARESEDFELLWMNDVHGLPPESAPLSALARARDTLLVEEVRESLGAASCGRSPGACADAVLLRGPDGRARIGSVCSEMVEEAELNLPHIEVGDPHVDAQEGSEFARWLSGLPVRVAEQRRLASIWESAWGPLDTLRLPEHSEGTRGTWPRYVVRLQVGGDEYPNAAWARWLKARGVRCSTPVRRLALGLDPDECAVRRQFPGAVEFLKRCLQFSCDPSITLEEAERTVYAVDELARRESTGGAAL